MCVSGYPNLFMLFVQLKIFAVYCFFRLCLAMHTVMSISRMETSKIYIILFFTINFRYHKCFWVK